MIKKTINYGKKLLKVDFIRFGMVGAVGFIVSEAVIFITFGRMGTPYVMSFIFANEAGLLATFVLHETWTYNHLNHKHKSLFRKLGSFHLSAWSGIVIILGVGIFAKAVLHLSPYVGQAMGSAIAMFWNFFWTRYFIFKGHTPQVLGSIEEPASFED